VKVPYCSVVAMTHRVASTPASPSSPIPTIPPSPAGTRELMTGALAGKPAGVRFERGKTSAMTQREVGGRGGMRVTDLRRPRYAETIGCENLQRGLQQLGRIEKYADTQLQVHTDHL